MHLHSTVPFGRPVPAYSDIRTGRKKSTRRSSGRRKLK